MIYEASTPYPRSQKKEETKKEKRKAGTKGRRSEPKPMLSRIIPDDGQVLTIFVYFPTATTTPMTTITDAKHGIRRESRNRRVPRHEISTNARILVRGSRTTRKEEGKAGREDMWKRICVYDKTRERM